MSWMWLLLIGVGAFVVFAVVPLVALKHSVPQQRQDHEAWQRGLLGEYGAVLRECTNLSQLSQRWGRGDNGIVKDEPTWMCDEGLIVGSEIDDERVILIPWGDLTHRGQRVHKWPRMVEMADNFDYQARMRMMPDGQEHLLEIARRSGRETLLVVTTDADAERLLARFA